MFASSGRSVYTYIILKFLQELAGVGQHPGSVKPGSEGDGDTGSTILGIAHRVVSNLVGPDRRNSEKSLKTSILGKPSSS